MKTTSVKETSQPDLIEGVNRARHAFRNFVERLNDRITLVGDACAKHYCNGRVALILNCEVSFPFNPEARRIVQKVGLSIGEKYFFSLVLKADIPNPHHIEYWEEQLVFVPNIHVVQGPQGPVPSLVGLYNIQHDPANQKSASVIGEALLFQSTIYGNYEFFPLVKDWKLCPSISEAGRFVHGLVVEHVESAPKVVQRVADNEGCICSGESGFVDVDADVIAPFVFFDSDGVKVRFSDGVQQFVKVTDVLCGPFNLTS